MTKSSSLGLTPCQCGWRACCRLKASQSTTGALPPSLPMMTCRYRGGYAPALYFGHAAANPALCSVLRAPLDALPALPAPALPVGLSTDARFTTSQSGLACRAHAMTRSCAAPRCSASGPPPALPSAQPPACLHPAQKHTTYTVQHATYNMQHTTGNIRRASHSVIRRSPLPSRSAAEPSVCSAARP